MATLPQSRDWRAKITPQSFNLAWLRKFEQEVDEGALDGGDGEDEEPDGEFADAQGTLAGGREPETDFGGAESDDITITQTRGDLGMIVDGGEGIGGGAQKIAVAREEFHGEMVVPNAGIIQAEVILRKAADVERKMADDVGIARHFTGKNLQLDHQKLARSTSI